MSIQKKFKKSGNYELEKSNELEKRIKKDEEQKLLGEEVGSFYQDFLNQIQPNQLINSNNNNDKSNLQYCKLCKMDININDYQHHLKSMGHLMNKPVQKNVSQVKLPSDNVGYQIMLKKGWKIHHGLGANNQGMKIPLQPKPKLDKLGIGNQSKSNNTNSIESIDQKTEKVKRKQIEKQLLKDKRDRQYIMSFLNH